MRNARVMGNYIQYLAENQSISKKAMAEILECSEDNVLELYKGFVYPSFTQITKLADVLSVSVESIVNGDDSVYKNTVVHCMNDFSNEENREKILDIIENYFDIRKSVSDIK